MEFRLDRGRPAGNAGQKPAVLLPSSCPPCLRGEFLCRLARGAVSAQMSQTFLRRMDMSDSRKPRLIGITHVAIEVGDIDEAVEWYGKIFDFNLRNRHERAAFIDMGDQFINLT